MNDKTITIVVEIPHQSKVTAWVAESDADIIKEAFTNRNWDYREWDRDSAISCWGDVEDFPQALQDALSKSELVIEYGHDDDPSFTPQHSAPSEIEVAKQAISDDLSGCYFLTEEEARAFDLQGHGSVQAVFAVKKVMEDLL
jgi:hypothetical protein